MKIIPPHPFLSINHWKTTTQYETSNSPLARLSIAGSNHGLSCREDFTINSEYWHFSREMLVIASGVGHFSREMLVIVSGVGRFSREMLVIDNGVRHFSREMLVIASGVRHFSREMLVIDRKGTAVFHGAGLALEAYENKKPQISQMTQIFFLRVYSCFTVTSWLIF